MIRATIASARPLVIWPARSEYGQVTKHRAAAQYDSMVSATVCIVRRGSAQTRKHVCDRAPDCRRGRADEGKDCHDHSYDGGDEHSYDCGAE
ncbi:hypothetical protein GCM10007887_30160 [Methylobacterium haplocladii]|uniref:Uncharacterized protein n=1 Tax=Methylobacterium haplocladii TaxID=1176176 RepID=A0A512IKC5_9HYPH|nr:hypothetical protein MHA02_05320 [Methylobacterium haplocladii]GJD83609.1 hypothetical protein HPGCJGGD_1479 [Methylobacterium haplocladii]GLS60337.1 hypothetical protein GCM10007887_30160 [Methylobacterium haplocladii]